MQAAVKKYSGLARDSPVRVWLHLRSVYLVPSRTKWPVQPHWKAEFSEGVEGVRWRLGMGRVWRRPWG